MRRKVKSNPVYHARLGHIKSDFTVEQLAGIGAVAMEYNEAEVLVDQLLYIISGLPRELQLEVGSRINGIDGKIEIIKKGAPLLGLEQSDLTQLEIALGDDWFGRVKKYRDAVIHARIFNAPLATGVRVGRRAEVFEVLLSRVALDILYDHITVVRVELSAATRLLLAARAAKMCAPDDPGKALLEANKARCSTQFRATLDLKQSLRPLPEFPSEQQLRAAQDAWQRAHTATQMLTWFQPLSEPQRLRRAVAKRELTEPPQPPKKK